MKENKEKDISTNKTSKQSKKNRLIGISVVCILILIIAIIVGMKTIKNNEKDTNIINQNDTKNNTSNEEITPTELYNSIIDIQDYVENDIEDKDYAKYKLNLIKAFKDKRINDIKEDYNIYFKYEIEGYNIQMKLLENHGDIAYKLYLNDKYVDDIATFKDITVEKLGKYLIYYNGVCTDTRCGEIYIYDNANKIMTLNEFDNSNKGLVRGKIYEDHVASNNGITIKTSRFGHNLTLYANNKSYELLSKKECQNVLDDSPDNLIVEATYTYKYENGILSLLPEISDKITLKEYIESSQDACSQE